VEGKLEEMAEGVEEERMRGKGGGEVSPYSSFQITIIIIVSLNRWGFKWRLNVETLSQMAHVVPDSHCNLCISLFL